jgi:hypothetical protein
MIRLLFRPAVLFVSCSDGSRGFALPPRKSHRLLRNDVGFQFFKMFVAIVDYSQTSKNVGGAVSGSLSLLRSSSQPTQSKKQVSDALDNVL